MTTIPASQVSGANGEALPEFPDPKDQQAAFAGIQSADVNTCMQAMYAHMDYEKARADAWEARARLAVEALSCLYPGIALDLRYCGDDDDRDALVSRVKCIEETLTAIGPLPSPKEQRT